MNIKLHKVYKLLNGQKVLITKIFKSEGKFNCLTNEGNIVNDYDINHFLNLHKPELIDTDKIEFRLMIE